MIQLDQGNEPAIEAMLSFIHTGDYEYKGGWNYPREEPALRFSPELNHHSKIGKFMNRFFT